MFVANFFGTLVSHNIVSKGQTKDLLKFLKPFRKEVKENTLWLRDFVWDLYPKANELI